MFGVSREQILTRPEFTAEASGEYVENPLFVSLVSGGLGAFLGATVLFTLGRTADSLVTRMPAHNDVPDCETVS